MRRLQLLMWLFLFSIARHWARKEGSSVRGIKDRPPGIHGRCRIRNSEHFSIIKKGCFHARVDDQIP